VHPSRIAAHFMLNSEIPIREQHELHASSKAKPMSCLLVGDDERLSRMIHCWEEECRKLAFEGSFGISSVALLHHLHGHVLWMQLSRDCLASSRKLAAIIRKELVSPLKVFRAGPQILYPSAKIRMHYRSMVTELSV